MNAQTWLIVLRAVLWIGMCLTAIGTVGSQWLSVIVQKGKEAAAAAKQDTLIAQNDKLQKDLAERDRQVNQLLRSGRYRPLAAREGLVQGLKGLEIKGLNEIVVSDWNTNDNGKRIASDLVTLLVAAGIDAKRGFSKNTYPSQPGRPYIEADSNTMSVASKLGQALEPFIRTPFEYRSPLSFREGAICVVIYGAPSFNEDGSVEFD